MSISTINSTDNGSTSLTKINDNFTDLDTTKADLASPTFIGSPVLPTGTTGVTQSASDNSTKLATTAYVDNQITINPSGLTLLGSSTLSGENSSITVSSLSVKTYLRIVLYIASIATSDAPKIRFNSDTGNNYAYNLSRNGGAASPVSNTSGIKTAGDGTGQCFVTLDIYNPSSSSKLVCGISLDGGSGSTLNAVSTISGVWNSNTQINSITVVNDGSYNFGIGSSLLVYGI
jgi:hypothetical protein